jgi:hypothetical protein
LSFQFNYLLTVVNKIISANMPSHNLNPIFFGVRSRGENYRLGIPVDRDRSFRFVVTGDSGSS